MAIQLALMIEGQEGLTWDRWRALAQAAEETGYSGLFRSDHLTGLFGDSSHPSLDAWASLTWLATHTQRIRFGPLVCPLTFYHPALLARRAAAVAELSGGRLDLGIGAGWHEGEHAMFGVPFPPLKERLDRLECGARAIRALWQGRPVTLARTIHEWRYAESALVGWARGPRPRLHGSPVAACSLRTGRARSPPRGAGPRRVESAIARSPRSRTRRRLALMARLGPTRPPHQGQREAHHGVHE